VTADPAFDKIGQIRQLKMTGAVRLDLTVAFHCIQATREPIQFIRFDA
jgi:hypothetical protein